MEEVLLGEQGLLRDIDAFLDVASLDLLFCKHLHDLGALQVDRDHTERANHAEVCLSGGISFCDVLMYLDCFLQRINSLSCHLLVPVHLTDER